MKRYLAALLVVLGVVGVVGVLAVGTGFANDDNAARAKCSKATLAGYDVFDGNGKIDSVVSANFNGQVIRKVHTSGTYTLKTDCTGTATFQDGGQIDMFIAPDGSMFTFVEVKPKTHVTSGFELRATAKRVAP
jgi:hypothetical protein